MIRNAVGAIITQGDEILLVHKVKMMDGKNGPEETPGQWDFPKGGVLSSDLDLSSALLRELKEETGSAQYRVIKKFEEKICFEFPKFLREKLGYESQETTMFQVEYIGDRTELKPQDKEIDQVNFFPKSNVLGILFHEDSKEFYKRFVQFV